MAAAMFRRGTGSCVRCLQWELCRVVWRPQAALYSSKPSKQPRRTHIKKGKPEPAVDVAKLLEQIFSQQRPGTARPAGKVRPAKASSVFTKPPPTSSSSSKTEPAVSVFPAASSVKHVGADTSSGSSQTSTQTECQPSAETIETKVETAAEPVELTELTLSAPFPAATVEPLIETTLKSPVEPLLSPAETLEMKEAVVEGPVESTIDLPAEETQASGEVSQEEPLVETTLESQIETSQFPVETLETRAVDGPVEPTVDQKVETKSTDSDVVDILHTKTVEPTLEKVEPSVEAITSQAAAAEFALEPTVDATVEAPAQVVQTNNLSHTAAEEPLIETTIDASVESSILQMETPESRAAVAESSVGTLEAEAETAAQFAHSVKEEPLIETAIESPVEASNFPLETQADEGPVEPTVEAQKVETNSTDSGIIHISYITKDEPLIETTIEAAVESEEGLSRSEEMTLESVTLLEDELLVASLKTDELLQTKSLLDERAEKELQELLVQTETGAQSEAAAQTESEMFTEVLSKWESLSEDLQELEGESGLLVKELLCDAPAVLSKPPSAGDPPAGGSGEPLQETEAVSMTLESITLSNVKAEVGGLDSEILQETRNALEEEAGVFAEKEKMEVTPTEEEVTVFEETAGAEMLTLDSICEATDAIEAEAAVMLEAMFGSEQGLRLPLQKQEQLDGSPGNESRGEQQEVGVLEAMSLESVTLAEVEASLGALENESLGETADYLEKEADMVVGEKRAEVEEASEETVEALEEEEKEEAALSDDLEIDALMEELLFSEPGQVAQSPMGQETVRADMSHETVVHVDAAAVLDSSPASPSLTEELLEEKKEEEEEEEEEGAQGSEEQTGTHADLDPVQRLFLEKIREYKNMHRLSGGLLEAEPDYEKYLLEETAKLQRLYGGGDLNGFPQFTFSDPEMDQDSK